MRIWILIFGFKGLSVDASKRDKEKAESHNWNINYFSNIKCLSLKMLGTLLFRKFSTKNFAFALIIRPLAFDSDSRTLKLFSCFWKHLHSAPYGRVLVWVPPPPTHISNLSKFQFSIIVLLKTNLCSKSTPRPPQNFQ